MRATGARRCPECDSRHWVWFKTTYQVGLVAGAVKKVESGAVVVCGVCGLQALFTAAGMRVLAPGIRRKQEAEDKERERDLFSDGKDADVRKKPKKQRAPMMDDDMEFEPEV